MGFFGMFHSVRKVGYNFGYIVIRMDVRILRISPMDTDFFYFLLEIKHWGLKKSVSIGEIRKIRTSIRITMYPNV
jgi:hypothetical protein